MPSPMLQPLMRGYVISRKPNADAEEDPTGSLEFWPAKGSDELYEALKEAFPAYKTHKERMREAVLDFLLQERDQETMASRTMSNTSAATSFTTMPDSAMPSPAYFMQPSQTSPDYLPSPESQLTNTFPSTPATNLDTAEQVSAIPSSMSVPGLREMTNVWSVSSSSQPKVRTRRAMTEAEKKEYRRKRIDGACTDCRRRRRKCDHESSESDSSSKGVKKARKTAKITASTAKHKAPDHPQHFLGQSSTGTSPNLSNNTSPQQQDALDLPSSMLWPEDSLDFLDFDFDALSGSEGFNSPAMHDPMFDFINFDQGHAEGDLQRLLNNSGPDPWPPGSQPQNRQQHSSSGMIMPLPSYYAHTEVSQDHLSSGGMARSPTSPTNTPLVQPQAQQARALPLSRVSGDIVETIQPDDSLGKPEAERARSQQATPDGRPIPPRIGTQYRSTSDRAIDRLDSMQQDVPNGTSTRQPISAQAASEANLVYKYNFSPQGLKTLQTLSQQPDVWTGQDSGIPGVQEDIQATPGVTLRALFRGKNLHTQLLTDTERLAQYQDEYAADASSSSSSSHSSPGDTTGGQSTRSAASGILPGKSRSRDASRGLQPLGNTGSSSATDANSPTSRITGGDFAAGQIVRIEPLSPRNTFVDTGTDEVVIRSKSGALRAAANCLGSSHATGTGSGAEAGQNEHGLLWPTQHSHLLRASASSSAGGGATIPLPSWLKANPGDLPELQEIPNDPEWFHMRRKLQRKGVNAGHVVVGNAGNGGTEPTVSEDTPNRDGTVDTEWSHQQRTSRKLQRKASGNRGSNASQANNGGTEPIVENTVEHDNPAWHSRDSPWVHEPTTEKADPTHTEWWHAQRAPTRNGTNSPKIIPQGPGYPAAAPAARLDALVAVVLVAFFAAVLSWYGAMVLNGFTTASLLATIALRSCEVSSSATSDLGKGGSLRWRKAAGWWTHVQPMFFV